MITIKQIAEPAEIADAQTLVRELTGWALTLDPDADEAPAFHDLEAEIASLPGVFSPPEGCFLLAREDAYPAGCIAFCSHGPGVVELKRMYVRPDQRGKGLGQQLVDRLIEQARQRGIQRIVLDSYHTMTGAHRIYRAAGFRDVGPPEGFPKKFVPVVVFMELEL